MDRRFGDPTGLKSGELLSQDNRRLGIYETPIRTNDQSSVSAKFQGTKDLPVRRMSLEPTDQKVHRAFGRHPF